MERFTRTLIAITVMALAAAACSTAAEGEAGKSGGAGTPIILTIGTNDPAGRTASNQIEEFARRVNDLSDGYLTIEPVWRVGDGPDWDQQVARKVMSGELDMGNIPTRAWDTEGVTSMRAINAPFLITTDSHLDDVVTGGLAGEMLAGLASVGVVGLALLPESLRHPFGYSGPLMGPADYAGATLRAPLSATTNAMFAALGAETTQVETDIESQVGTESSYSLAPPLQGPATGNITFYPKVNALVINAESYAGLTSDQREILDRASAETLSWTVDSRPSDLEAAAAFCEDGGTIVLADATTLDALVAATRPVYAELEADPQTRELIERIGQLGEANAMTATNPGACGDRMSAGPETGTDQVGDDVRAINGVYRVEMTQEMFDAAGVPDEQAEWNLGVSTYTFRDGKLYWQGAEPDAEPEYTGEYTVDGDQMTVVYYPDGTVAVYGWSLAENGDLHLAVVEAEDEWAALESVFTANPWVRIGDAETPEAALDGTYRFELTQEMFEAADVPDSQASGMVGPTTIVLRNGEVFWPEDGDGEPGGRFTIEDDLATFTWFEDSEVVSVYRWSLAPNGDLSLAVVETDDEWSAFESVFTANPWVRIGDAG